jgi:hypothetical protein
MAPDGCSSLARVTNPSARDSSISKVPGVLLTLPRSGVAPVARESTAFFSFMSRSHAPKLLRISTDTNRKFVRPFVGRAVLLVRRKPMAGKVELGDADGLLR